MSLIDLTTATGYELDAAGRLQLIHRQQGEDDASFRSRLMQADLAATTRSLANYPVPGGGPLMASQTTLRDYFAAKAMQIAYDGHAPEYLAEVAYQMADAMLAERAK